MKRQKQISVKSVSGEEDEINLLDYWEVIWRGKWLILVLVFVSVTATMLISLRLPKIYESTATVLPPEIEELGAPRLNLNMPGFATQSLPDLFSKGSSSDLIIAMLKSRRMAEDVIERFRLKDTYETEYTIDAIKRLRKSTDISTSRENVISIKAESRDPKLAANIANFYVSNLDTMNQGLQITSAKPIVRVLDIAKPAEKKSKPRVKLNMAISGALALFVGIFLCFFLDYVEKQKRGQ